MTEGSTHFSMPQAGVGKDKSGIIYVYGYSGDKIRVFSNAFSFLCENAITTVMSNLSHLSDWQR